jgi:hypothetical protein
MPMIPTKPPAVDTEERSINIFDKRIPVPMNAFLKRIEEEEQMDRIPHYAETVEVRTHSRLLNGMRMRRLPHSNIVVSEIGLGTLTFGEQVTREKAHDLLDMAVKDYGVNLLVSLSLSLSLSLTF